MALDYAIIGQRLKKARIKKHLTQENLAEERDKIKDLAEKVEKSIKSISLE